MGPGDLVKEMAITLQLVAKNPRGLCHQATAVAKTGEAKWAHALCMSVGEQSRGFAKVWRAAEDLRVKGSREAIQGVTPGTKGMKG